MESVIEDELAAAGYVKTLKSFILNRNRATAQDTLVSCKQAVEEYILQQDWRVNANANTAYSNAGLINNSAGKIIANYWLDNVYSPEEGQAHRRAVELGHVGADGRVVVGPVDVLDNLDGRGGVGHAAT